MGLIDMPKIDRSSLSLSCESSSKEGEAYSYSFTVPVSWLDNGHSTEQIAVEKAVAASKAKRKGGQSDDSPLERVWARGNSLSFSLIWEGTGKSAFA